MIGLDVQFKCDAGKNPNASILIVHLDVDLAMCGVLRLVHANTTVVANSLSFHT